MKRLIIGVIAAILLVSAATTAQETRSEVAIQAIGLFTKSSTGNDRNGSLVTGTEGNTGGALFSYRYHLATWLSVEGGYGVAHDSLRYTTAYGTYNGNVHVHEATGAFVLSLPSSKTWKFSPYLVSGAGALIFQPASTDFRESGGSRSVGGVTRQAKPAFLYGAGIDVPFTKHWSVRGEYRGLVSHVPDFGVATFGTGSLTHSAQPSLGFTFRF